ncbi:hypothetical protein SAMN06296386_10851 [Lachnospiraceae bacterium]|nr:hypothetical protein SAMN06296386_10851 [Lachnospiraceae bacterium]
MVALNDYLYNGDTVLKIIRNYSSDLRKSAIETGNSMDLFHCNFLLQLEEILEHNDFLTSQSQRLKEFYKFMAVNYPFLAFTFKGRIKSLIRAEEKFNGYIVEMVYDHYKKHKEYPDPVEVKKRIRYFRDLIAYRIVIALPKCHIENDAERRAKEQEYLYEIAASLPDFLEQRGFSAELSAGDVSDRLSPDVKMYFRDYIQHPSYGYQSLHITLFDNETRSYVEVQLRTKEMDDFAEIGPANHLGYEKRQMQDRTRRESIPEGECLYFDESYKRGVLLQNLELSKVDVNMFSAANNNLINDGCGLYRGRLILPYEHLSRFQNDIID